MKQILQYVTRKRRSDLEQLEHPDCYDEYIGRESTGKIAKSITPLVYLDISPVEEKNHTEDTKIETVIVEKRKRTHLEVIHGCGKSIVECDYEYNIKDYESYLNSIYWDGFVIEIRDII